MQLYWYSILVSYLRNLISITGNKTSVHDGKTQVHHVSGKCEEYQEDQDDDGKICLRNSVFLIRQDKNKTTLIFTKLISGLLYIQINKIHKAINSTSDNTDEVNTISFLKI